jgi:ribosomal protein S18 acetylase RimI-like enzyme
LSAAAVDDRRLEELTLNSSAPPGQLLFDGWILRLAPGKAKRARSVNAVYASSLPLARKIAHCERLYAAAGLPMLFRITPFSEPAGLDRELDSRGYVRFDETAVEACALDPRCAQAQALPAMPLDRWVGHVAALRGSPPDQLEGHRARLEGLPLARVPVALEEGARVVATGLAIVEDDTAGLFDIVTHPEARRRGHAKRVVDALLRAAWELGARQAYLQVQADNLAARALYARLGFRERYRYWYRARPGEAR